MHLRSGPPTARVGRRPRVIAGLRSHEERLTESAARRKRRAAEDRERKRRRSAEDQARQEARRAEDQARHEARKAEDQARQEARRAQEEELDRLRRAEDRDVRTDRQVESILLKQQRRTETLHRRQLRKEAKTERRAQHAAEVLRAREADAAARELLKQYKAEARQVHQLRKAEDARLRRERKAEDAERRRAVAADDRVRWRRKRRWTLVFGLGLLAVALSLAGYIGWQLWGTNWVSARTQERIVEQVQEEWSVASGPTVPQGEPPPAAEPTPVAEPPTLDVPEGEVSGLIKIPKFGSDYVIPVLEGTSDKVLAAGFGHFSGSADPGQVGNYALAAHRVTHGEPLREMPSLDVGDKVIVDTRYATYTYVLTTGGDDLRVTFRDIWVIDPVPTNPDPGGVEPKQASGQRLITLTTCAELFHTDDRLIAFGILEDTKLKS